MNKNNNKDIESLVTIVIFIMIAFIIDNISWGITENSFVWYETSTLIMFVIERSFAVLTSPIDWGAAIVTGCILKTLLNEQVNV